MTQKSKWAYRNAQNDEETIEGMLRKSWLGYEDKNNSNINWEWNPFEDEIGEKCSNWNHWKTEIRISFKLILKSCNWIQITH